ncbi:MAG: Gfo/Idh/MocA family protein [Halobacteriaceae archaeon]
MTLRVAFIGAGGRASSHLQNVGEMDDAEVVAVCDIDEDVARDAAEPHGAAVYTEHEPMYEQEDIDAVFVGVPPFAHTDQELMAAERGIHLFVEKPIALSVEKAEEILDAVEANGVVAQVGYQMRYAEATERALELTEGRPIGLVDGYYKTSVPGTAWWRVFERSGGQIVEQVTHIYDLVRHVVGEVEEVTAYGGHRIVDEIDFEDSVTASMRHENDAVSNIDSTSAASQHSSGIELVGGDVQLTLEGNSLTGVVDGEEVDFEGEGDMSRAEVESFVEAARTGDDAGVRSTYADAVRTLALTLAVNESLASGDPVEPRA